MEARVPVWTIDRFHEEYSGSVARLGVGGFGVVHLVHDRSGKRRAAKVVQILDDQGKASLRREVQVLWELRAFGGEHALHIVDYFEQGAQGLLVTEYLSGGELFSRCSRRDYRFTETKCKLFASSLLKAVAFIHSAGIIHLDIKPENVMFVSNFSEDIKLIDFGLARRLPSYGRVSTMPVGTVGFMAPEVARCHHASPASDIWSLGCLLFMLLTGGVEPFWKPGRPAVTTQRKARRGEFSWPANAKDHLSEDACDLANNLLVVRPGDRLSAEEALRHPWLQGAQYLQKRFPARKESPVLDTAKMRSWLARRRWLKAGTVLRAIQRMAKYVNSESHSRKGTQELPLSNYSRLQKILDDLDKM